MRIASASIAWEDNIAFQLSISKAEIEHPEKFTTIIGLTRMNADRNSVHQAVKDMLLTVYDNYTYLSKNYLSMSQAEQLEVIDKWLVYNMLHYWNEIKDLLRQYNIQLEANKNIVERLLDSFMNRFF